MKGCCAIHLVISVVIFAFLFPVSAQDVEDEEFYQDITIESTISESNSFYKPSTQLLITWQTATPTTARILYGSTNNLQQKSVGTDFADTHSIVLTGLDPSTPYILEIVSRDRSGVEYSSGKLHTITPKVMPTALEVITTKMTTIFNFLDFRVHAS